MKQINYIQSIKKSPISVLILKNDNLVFCFDKKHLHLFDSNLIYIKKLFKAKQSIKQLKIHSIFDVLAFTTSNNLIVVDFDKNTLLVNYDLGKEEDVFDFYFSPTHSQILIEYHYAPVLFDYESLEIYPNLFPHDGSVGKSSFSPNGKLIQSSSFDQTCTLYKSNNFEPINLLQSYSKEMHFAEMTNDQNFLVSISGSDINLFNLKTGNYTCLKPNEGYINEIDLSTDSQKILSCHENGVILIWDIGKGKILSKITDSNGRNITKATFSDDANYIISNYEDRTFLFT